MSVQMTPDEVREFLTATPPRTGKLATTRADGSPHVAPIWFDVDDGGDIIFMTGAVTQKGRALARDPRAAMCVDDERPPFAFVLVEGTVELSEDPEELRHWAARIGGRYMGAERADALGERNAVAGELLVRLRPEKVVAVRDMAD
jgi:PPOX class probable F420-dependent enzyme